ncbi:MAG: hypothetical protein R8P61_07525 [Bacteroidia bacterium]|nr:hypothetical protein [Bacteroidia bacterium]
MNYFNRFNSKLLSFFSVLTLASLAACQLDPLADLNWDTDLILPLAKTEITLDQVLQDSNIVENDENLWSLAFREKLSEANLQELVDFPDLEAEFGFKLDELELSSDTITQTITLAELARGLVAQGNIIGQIILAAHGQTIPSLPANNGLSSGVIPIDASDFFQFARVAEGELLLKMENQLPLDIQNVRLEVRNKSLPGPPIVSDTFAVIPARTSVTESYDLSGKEVESQLEGELINVDIAAGTNVPIDTNDFIRLTLVVQNLKAETATAVFPQQTLLDTIRETIYRFDEEFADIRISKVKVKSGKIKADAISTVEDTVSFAYALESAFNELGEKPSLQIKIPPATPTTPSTLIVEQPLEGFTIDLTSNGTTYNTILEGIQINLVESGTLVTLDQQDSVFVLFTLTDLEPVYVEGYLGNRKVSFQGENELNVFKDIEFENIRFEEPEISLIIENSMGVNTDLTINKLEGINSERGTSTELRNDELLAGPLPINRPQLPDTNGVASTQLDFTIENSNVRNFSNILLDKLIYDIDVQVNRQGFQNTFLDFGTDNSKIESFVEVSVPFHASVEGLVFSDEVELNPETLDLEQISQGILRIVIENRFPMEAIASISLLDKGENVLTVLAQEEVIEAGRINEVGYVEETLAGNTLIEKEYTAQELTDILGAAEKLKINFRLDTDPINQSVKIFADYSLNVSLVGQFKSNIP